MSKYTLAVRELNESIYGTLRKANTALRTCREDTTKQEDMLSQVTKQLCILAAQVDHIVDMGDIR